jgi:ribonucleoside-diphosphate reductase alpha chain/ribonucleoside-triphosphate reductase
VPALRQLENYIRFQKHYTQHNSSNTITVRPEEWAGVERAISEVWDDFVGVSFLAHDGGTYQLAPYEAITKEQYEALRTVNKPFDPAFWSSLRTSGSRWTPRTTTAPAVHAPSGSVKQ